MPPNRFRSSTCTCTRFTPTSRVLRRLVEAGYGRRIMFGSDQMVWPGAIAAAIDAITSADFLMPSQKRDILHDNAARFLRLEQRASKSALGAKLQ